MARYYVTARLTGDRGELKDEINSGRVKRMLPFGPSLHHSLKHARYHADSDRWVWEELDFCSPPLAQEREALLDRFFEDIHTEQVRKGEGWRRTAGLPPAW
jgi:hypothetical protein